MAGLNIPGVTDPYGTNQTVEKLMQVEKIPLTREQNQLEQYKAQRQAWRELNSQLTSLRESVKNLYSFENPFNNKITTSTDENAITATANRSAELQSFKVDVIQKATSDRFLTDELDSNFQVPPGNYVYKVKDKQVSVNWKGGSLKNFSDALNKRGNGIVKSMIIGASAGKKTLLIEAVPTGSENKLIFEGKAKDFAYSSGMISNVPSEKQKFATSSNELLAINPSNQENNSKLPTLSLAKTSITNGTIHIEPRGAFQVNIPQNVLDKPSNTIALTIRSSNVQDITEALNNVQDSPILPDAGFAIYEGIVVKNTSAETLVKAPDTPKQHLDPIVSKNVLYALNADGTETIIPTPDLLSGQEILVNIPLNQYNGIKSLVVKNENTGLSLEVSGISSYDTQTQTGYKPNHPVEEAGDCIIKYEGIRITRPTNDIDDVVPEVTLNVHDQTEKTATITIKPDKQSSKDALIEFVGKYNQAVAKINVLSQNKSEIVEELEYLSDDEKAKLQEQLGMFQTDFTLTSVKSNMQTILSSPYKFSEYSTLSMLSQIGIATNASGFSGSYSQSRLRGYLEIDEKKLDQALENDMEDIKNLFGFDADGDLIIDSGIAFKLDKQLTAYTQTGGVLSLKTSSLDSKIKSSESKITKLEDQMKDKEAELKTKFSQMQGSLNSLESQQSTINNFTRQQNNNSQR